MKEQVKIGISDEELLDLEKELDKYIEEEWPEQVRYIIKPSPHDYDKASELKNWLLWLRGDVERVYRNDFSISKDFPIIPLIPKYKADGVEIPSEIKVQNEKQNYNFYEVRVYFHTELENHILLKKVKVKLSFKDMGAEKDRETVVISMLPDNTYKNILKSNTTAKVAFTADGKAKAEIPNLNIKFGEVKGDASVVASINSSTDLTLPEIKINKTIISAVGVHHNECAWEFEEVQAEEDIQVLAILKVPKEVAEVKLSAVLEVTPYKDEWWPLPDTRLKSIKTSREKKLDLRT